MMSVEWHASIAYSSFPIAKLVLELCELVWFGFLFFLYLIVEDVYNSWIFTFHSLSWAWLLWSWVFLISWPSLPGFIHWRIRWWFWFVFLFFIFLLIIIYLFIHKSIELVNWFLDFRRLRNWFINSGWFHNWFLNSGWFYYWFLDSRRFRNLTWFVNSRRFYY